MKQVALLIAVNKQGQVLLQHKDDGAPNYPNTWCMFGGAVEPGETMLEAVQRELIEELEWKLVDLQYLGSYDSDGVHREAFVVRTEQTAEALRKTQHEGDDLGYFSELELESIKIAPPHLALLRIYFESDLSQ